MDRATFTISCVLADFCESMRAGDLFAAGMSLGSAHARLNMMHPCDEQQRGYELIEAAKDAEEILRPNGPWTSRVAKLDRREDESDADFRQRLLGSYEAAYVSDGFVVAVGAAIPEPTNNETPAQPRGAGEGEG